MKKSYIKILVLQIVLVFIILFVDFVMNRLTSYTLIGLLAIGLVAFKLILGHEKGRYRNTKDMLLTIIIYTTIALLFMYLLGVFVSFIKSPNYWTKSGLLNFIIPAFLNIFIVEFFRNSIIQKSEESKFLLIITTVFFIFVDIILKINVMTFASPYNILVFVAYYLLPSVAKNVMCTYLSYKVGYIPPIAYRIMMETYAFFLPIYPEFGEYINSIIRLLIPSILAFILYKSLHEVKIEEPVASNNGGKVIKKVAYGIAFITIGVFIYLTSANFKYFSLAIGSGSMTPIIHKGDMVIIRKLSEDEKYEVELGQVLAYKYGNIIIVHRIVDIYQDKNQFYVYTKGDANEDIDNYPIDVSMMVGIVEYDIPLIGYPSVIANESVR